MTGFSALLTKEILEIRRTWKARVLLAVIAFAAVTGPFIARYAPQIIGSTLGAELDLSLPDPTWADSYAQWVKSLTQIIVFLVIILAALSLGSELRTGTAQGLATAPVDRSAIIVAKLVADAGLVAISLGVGTLIVAAETRLLFGAAPAGELIGGTLTWLCGALFLMSATMCASALTSTGPAIATGIALYLVISLAGMWEPARRWSPAGALGAGDGEIPAIASCLLLAAACTAGAIWALERRDI